MVPPRAPGPLPLRHRHGGPLPAVRTAGRRRGALHAARDPPGRSLEGALGRVRAALVGHQERRGPVTPMSTTLRIVDVINTAASAKEILLDRARPFHRPPAVG